MGNSGMDSFPVRVAKWINRHAFLEFTEKGLGHKFFSIYRTSTKFYEQLCFVTNLVIDCFIIIKAKNEKESAHKHI